MQAFRGHEILVESIKPCYNRLMVKIYPPDERKPNTQKAILKILADKPAIPLETLKNEGEKNVRGLASHKYAVARSVKNLVESGHAELINSGHQDFIRLTQKGKTKLNVMRLEGENVLVSTTWDGFWRIIILDMPEDRKNEREALRYLLKKANFVCIKNTVWISPLPYENLFTNIKKDLGLTTELMIIITNKLDEETNLAFLNAVKK